MLLLACNFTITALVCNEIFTAEQNLHQVKA